MRHSCKQIETPTSREWSGWRLVRSFFVFHLLRWYPVVGGLAAAPCAARCKPLEAPEAAAAAAPRRRTRA